VTRLVLLATSPRVAAGLLSAEAWDAVRAGPVLTGDHGTPQLGPLRTAGVVVSVLDPMPAAAAAEQLLAAAAATGTATWLAATADDPSLPQALADLADRATIDAIHGSWDVPGARLIDVVAIMDRLRSPGGCPWDAGQDHASLAPHLLDEAYEAFQAIEDDDTQGLREELGDVLLQVVFHARMAQELPAPQRWTVDDVADGLVNKLVRRHPHVFGDPSAARPADEQTGWEAIKAAERGDASALSNIPISAPALTLAATVQRKAARLGVPQDLMEPAASPASAGEMLWAAVAALRSQGIDAEASLRSRVREIRDQIMSVEAALRADDLDPANASPEAWRTRWEVPTQQP
jgi:XTP/dITP diphosphohydrolase